MGSPARSAHLGRLSPEGDYQTPIPEQASSAVLRGVQAAAVSSKAGFVTVQWGRLQVDADTVPTR